MSLNEQHAIQAIAFLVAGALLTVRATTIVPAAYTGVDDDGGDGNKNKPEDESAPPIADRDDNEVEQAGFDCIAIGVSDIEADLSGILGLIE